MLLTGQHHYPIPVDVKQCMWSLLASQMNRVASPVVHALHGSIFLILVPRIHYYLACKIVSTFGLWTGNLLDWTANGVVQGCTSIHQTVTPRSQLSTNVYFYSPDVFYSSPNVPTVTLKGFSSFFFLDDTRFPNFLRPNIWICSSTPQRKQSRQGLLHKGCPRL